MADMRIVDTIKYGLVSAVRTEVNPDICLGLYDAIDIMEDTDADREID